MLKNRSIINHYQAWIVASLLVILYKLSYISSFLMHSGRTNSHTIRTRRISSLSPSKNTIITLSLNNNILTTQQSSNKCDNSKTTHLVFPGGGIFFYWQAGAITYLREQNYNLDTTEDNENQKLLFTGASAGALCATLTCTNVDFIAATTLALDKSEEAGIWDRPLGLYGIWGDIIEEWLYELLPDDSIDLVNDRVSKITN